MFIPKELITYILGLITFPIICYIIYIIKYKENYDQEIHAFTRKKNKCKGDDSDGHNN